MLNMKKLRNRRNNLSKLFFVFAFKVISEHLPTWQFPIIILIKHSFLTRYCFEVIKGDLQVISEVISSNN